jgi:hypothetical protein
MKKIVTGICFAVALPIIVVGVLWAFAKDAFRAGKELGATLLEYLES